MLILILSKIYKALLRKIIKDQSSFKKFAIFALIFGSGYLLGSILKNKDIKRLKEEIQKKQQEIEDKIQEDEEK